MEREVFVRRMAHAAVALAPIYYLLPVDLPVVGFRRWILLIVFISAMFAFESVRVWKKFTFLGLRPHEKDRLASHAWAAVGLVLVLWLFPRDIASGAIVGWALVDPLMGEMRSRKMRPRTVVIVSAAFYLVLALIMFFLWSERSSADFAVLALVGTAVAIPAEYVKIRHIDDDFMMSVLPALGMLGVAVAFFSQQL